MRNLNLCIDYSNICFRALFTCKYTNAEINNFDTEEECNVFARKVTNDICSLMKTFNPNEVFLFLDSKEPWRESVCPNYKGTRKRDDSINMKNILSVMEDLLDIFRDKGMNIFRVWHAEADDIAALYKVNINKDSDCSSVFVTSDADWLQLVDFDEQSKRYTCVYNPIVASKSINKLFCTDKFEEWVETNDSMEIFCDYTSTKRKIVEAMAYNSRINLYVIDPEKVLMDKILFGDDGDNIPAFFQYYKSGRKVRLTEKKFEKVRSLLETEIDNVSDLERVNEGRDFIDAIGKVFKYDTSKLDGEVLLKTQRDCVELNPNRFPDDIVEEFSNMFLYYKKHRNVPTSYLKSVDSVLKGTKYEKKTFSSNGAKLNRIFGTIVDNTFTDITNIDYGF